MFAALRAGADGYLLMTMSPGRLGYALRGVARGEAALAAHDDRALILEFRERGTGAGCTCPRPEPRSS